MFNNLQKERQGEVLVLSSTLLWALFPIISILSFSLISPIFSAGISSLFSGIFFGLVIFFNKEWKKWKNIDFKIWKYTFYVGIINGLLLYGLVFWGLQFTTSGNASIIMLMEIFFNFIFFGLFLKEKLPKSHIFGAIFMVIGALFVIFPGKINLNIGDLIILFAIMFPPLGNFFQKKARKKLDSSSILFVRSLITAPIFLGICFFSNKIPSFDIFKEALPYLLINGFVIFGLSKLLFLDGFHRLSVQKSILLLSIAPFFTLPFAYFILDEIPTIWQLSGLIPILIGLFFLTKKTNK